MTETENKNWALSKLLETADSRLLTRRIVDMAMDSAKSSSEITRASNIFPDVMFREIAYKYGHVTKQFEIDLYNAFKYCYFRGNDLRLSYFKVFFIQ